MIMPPRNWLAAVFGGGSPTSAFDPERKLTTFWQAGETRAFDVPCEHPQSKQRAPKLLHPRDAALRVDGLQSVDVFLCFFKPAEQATRSHLQAQSSWISWSDLQRFVGSLVGLLVAAGTEVREADRIPVQMVR
jgi:hypothetical protein